VDALAVNANGVVALAGSSGSDLYLATIDTASMSPMGIPTPVPGTGPDHRGTGVAFSSAQTMLVSGFFDSTLMTSSKTLTSTGGDDALLLEVCLP
jgi:hypothetical protein